MREYKSQYITREQADKKWVLIDAEGQILGRVATTIANIARGKNKPTYTPSTDTGDFVVVINAEKIQVTGNKRKEKMYYRHSGYPGGLKETSLEHLLEKHPIRALEHAVRGMLPKNRLGRQVFKNIKIYSGSNHPHEAQNPVALDLAGKEA